AFLVLVPFCPSQHVLYHPFCDCPLLNGESSSPLFVQLTGRLRNTIGIHRQPC
ncbi:hypothetical protein BDZ94DRAFT_1278007, partial [Collybia nuda]